MINDEVYYTWIPGCPYVVGSDGSKHEVRCSYKIQEYHRDIIGTDLPEDYLSNESKPKYVRHYIEGEE